MYKWFHLQYLIREYKDKLSNYDIIYRLRTDVIIPTELFNQKINIMTIHCARDFIFYGRRRHFIRLFENFFDTILNTYYKKYQTRYTNINYSNFIKTKYPYYMWKWITYPKFIFNHNFNKLKTNISNNMKKLTLINQNNNTTDYISYLPLYYKKHSKFTSERVFPLYCLNYGYIEGIKLKFNLYKSRHNFNYIG